MPLFSVVSTILLGLEVYHVFSHAAVLFGVRLLPRKDLVRVRYYFLVDTGTVFLSAALIGKHLWWLVMPQILQHLYYFVNWESSNPAKKVITWSSLESATTLNGGRRFSPFLWDLVLGTTFDLVVHVIMVWTYLLVLPLSYCLVGFGLCLALVRMVMYNPRLAWSSKGRVEKWVERRIDPQIDY